MNFDSEYDVVVVGAGPGGSVTARDCARKGLKVLLLEKRQEIGAPKRCAEGVDMNTLKRLGYSGNERFVAQEIDGGYVYAPDGTRVSTPPGRGAIVERKVFDKFLAFDAARSGAKVCAKADAVGLIKEGGKVSGVVVNYGGKILNIRSKIVVAADGVESKIARLAGLKTAAPLKYYASGYQYEMAGIRIDDPKKMYFYFGQSIAPGGYIWIFPKGADVANVGIGISNNNERTAKGYLDSWIGKNPDVASGSIIEENAGGIPVGGFLEKMTADNFLAVGDAAHQVHPLHGGGLKEATLAGSMAAEVIVKAIKKGDTSSSGLDEYNKVWWKERGERLKKIRKAVDVIEKLEDADLNRIAKSIGGADIYKIQDGDLAALSKLFLKNPGLLKFAKYLV